MRAGSGMSDSDWKFWCSGLSCFLPAFLFRTKPSQSFLLASLSQDFGYAETAAFVAKIKRTKTAQNTPLLFLAKGHPQEGTPCQFLQFRPEYQDLSFERTTFFGGTRVAPDQEQ